MPTTIANSVLAEFQQEARTTRKFLERLPEDQLGWRPHEKSMTAGQLAMHIAASPGGVVEMARADSMPMPNPGLPQPSSVAEILAAHDASVARVREVLPTLDDAAMGRTWRIVDGEKVVLEMPRYNMVRSILMNHWIHHRGQFGVYLRLLGAKVPSSYGPSGDELPEFLAGR